MLLIASFYVSTDLEEIRGLWDISIYFMRILLFGNLRSETIITCKQACDE